MGRESAEAGFKGIIGGTTKEAGNLWKVGGYKEMMNLKSGLHAHHVGQSSLMSRFVPGFDHMTAPTILVPEIGHIKNLQDIKRLAISRGDGGFKSARDVVARDIFELRRVFKSQGIPNSSLQELIQMNKNMYPQSFIKHR